MQFVTFSPRMEGSRASEDRFSKFNYEFRPRWEAPLWSRFETRLVESAVLRNAWEEQLLHSGFEQIRLPNTICKPDRQGQDIRLEDNQISHYKTCEIRHSKGKMGCRSTTPVLCTDFNDRISTLSETMMAWKMSSFVARALNPQRVQFEGRLNFQKKMVTKLL